MCYLRRVKSTRSLKAEVDPLVECLPWLGRLVDINPLLRDHPPLLMVYRHARDNAVPDSLGDNVLGILLVVELELEADILERNLGIGERYLMNASLDDVVPEPEDKCLGPVGGEGLAVGGQGRLEG